MKHTVSLIVGLGYEFLEQKYIFDKWMCRPTTTTTTTTTIN
jgi:hypothetical protein